MVPLDAWMRSTLLARHGEHAEGIGLAQIVLGGEGKFREVGEVADIVGMDALRLALVAEMRDVVVGVAQRHLAAA